MDQYASVKRALIVKIELFVIFRSCEGFSDAGMSAIRSLGDGKRTLRKPSSPSSIVEYAH